MSVKLRVSDVESETLETIATEEAEATEATEASRAALNVILGERERLIATGHIT